MKSAINASYKLLADEELPGLIQMLETCMNFEKWGFTQSFSGVAKEFAPSVIYNSEKCRVRFVWLPADMRDGPESATLYILYGRRHATNHSRFRMWHARKCHCWHRTDIITKFLDGLSPQEAVAEWFKIPPIKNQFNQLNPGYNWSNVEWAARQESFLWEHYGYRLFDLFDISQPELWEQFSLFIKECYRLDPPIYNPSEPFPGFIC